MSRNDSRPAETLDTIFHDVRTPLTVISLRVQVLARDLDRGRLIESGQLRRHLGQVAEQLQVLQRVLNEAEQWQGKRRTGVRPEATSSLPVQPEANGRSGRSDELVDQRD